MEQITSLTITKISPRYWKYVSNLNPQGGGASAYTGTALGNFITTKTLTGGVLLKDVQWNVINYIDNLDPTKNMNGADVTVDELMSHLVEENFYVSVDVVGSVSGVTAFKQLLDTFSSFTGRNGQFLYVNEDEGEIDSMNNPIDSLRLQDLANFLSPTFARNKLVMTSNAGVANPDGSIYSKGFILVDPINYINRAPGFSEGRIVRKGYTWQDNTVVANTDTYATEIGDICDRLFYFDPDETYPFGKMWYMPAGRYKGGDESLISSYKDAALWGMPFDTDPDKEED